MYKIIYDGAGPAPSGSDAVELARATGKLPKVNLPTAFGGDGTSNGGVRIEDDDASLAQRLDDALLADGISPRSIMSDEVRTRASQATWGFSHQATAKDANSASPGVQCH